MVGAPVQRFGVCASMANRLVHENSLYLRQHAENPVDWWPWCAEAFERARVEDKPVLVSIGYSSCHWCHVMAHESFEDGYIADLMNRHFVCVKVDREERPDLDQIYMEAVTMIARHGGWPLNVFCLPDGRPFFGGTYFPAQDRGQNVVPWPQLLMRVVDYYRKHRDELVENAENIIANLGESNTPPGGTEVALRNEALIGAAEEACEAHDPEWGGFGGAPKFPPAMTLGLLLEVRRSAACEEVPGLARGIDRVMMTTLDAMARGGIYDQVGGGFARYSVDREWQIPHFEKMLYDNGLLLDVYVRGWLSYRAPLYAAVVEETVGWLLREMRVPEGGFAASIDADSEGMEGRYYVWKPEEVREVLGAAEGARFCAAYGVTAEGNFEHGFSNPVLQEKDFAKRQELAGLRARLLEARARRVAPAKDPKRLLAWNSLVIRGLARAGFYLGRKAWLEEARGAADWLWGALRFDGNRLRAVYYEGGARFNGSLDDYAFYAEALLALAAVVDWVEPGASARYVARAQTVARVVQERFADASGEPGFFFTSDDHEQLVSRKKEWWDNAMPAGNSSMVHVFGALHALTGEACWAQGVAKLRRAYSGVTARAPLAVSHALAGFAAEAVGIPVITVTGEGAVDRLREALAERPWRWVFLRVGEGQGTGYGLCVGKQCLAPVAEAREVAALV